MRRKRIVIADFDIYLIGIGLSKQSIAKAGEWCKTPEAERLPLSHYAVSKVSNAPGAPTITAVADLRMIRAVSRDVFIDAFRTAFVGVSAESFEEFRKVLDVSLGAEGAKVGETMKFLWLSNGELIMVKNGVYGGTLKNDELSFRLFDVYCDPTRTVSKELYDSLTVNVQKIVDLAKNSTEIQ
jgi:hypothetical protein